MLSSCVYPTFYAPFWLALSNELLVAVRAQTLGHVWPVRMALGWRSSFAFNAIPSLEHRTAFGAKTPMRPSQKCSTTLWADVLNLVELPLYRR